MKKIAIVSDSCPPHRGGGVGSAHFALYKAFLERGYEAKMFTFCDYQDPADRDTESVFRFGASDKVSKYLKMLTLFIFKIIFPGKLAWGTADVFVSAIGAWKMNRALQAYAPDIVLLPDHGAPAFMVQKKRGMKFGLIAHHNPMRFVGEPLIGDFSALDARITVWFENRGLRKVDRVSAPSHHMQEWFERTYKFDGEVTVIPNLADMDDVRKITANDIRSELGLPLDTILVGIPAADVQIKGTVFIYEIIERMAERYKEPFGVMIAGGKVHVDLAAQLEDVPEHVKLYIPGKLARETYLGIFKSCSFGIFPSVRDNYSMALIEASAMGIPMLAFDAGGNVDILQSGENGYLIDAFDVPAMAEKALEWMQDANALAALRKRTLAYADRAFDPEMVVQQYIDYFIEY